MALIGKSILIMLMNQETYFQLKNHISAIQTLHAQRPFRLNVITSAARGKLKEIAHSMILADILKIEEIRCDFLKTFMPQSYDANCKQYSVYRELHNMDISLINDKNYIIIENKVNDADEQDSQIFRYVEEARKSQKEVYVLYLNSISNAYPSGKSLNSSEGISVFKLIKEENFVVLSYMHDIIPWLENIQKGKKDNRYLETSLFQYCDYLKYHFNVNDEFMQKEINEIDCFLKINSQSSIDDRIQIYNEELVAVKSYLDCIEKARMTIALNNSKEWAVKLKEYWGKDLHLDNNKYDDKTGYIFSYNGMEFVFTTTDGKPWWGIRTPEESRVAVRKILESNFGSIETENSTWNFWHWTSYATIGSEMKVIHDELDKI